MKVFNSNFFRYYYNGTFTLDPKPQFHRKTHKRYIYLNIKTEKQLIYFILRKYGEGYYRVMGHAKGISGPFTFWKGEIDNDGYKFVNQEYFQKYKKELEEELFNKDLTDEEELDLVREIDDETTVQKIIKQGTRYGFHPFLLPSGQRGIYHTWDEPDDGINKPLNIKRKPMKFEEMSIDEINNF